MTLDDLPQYLREGLAFHESMRTLGFPADGIFMVVYGTSPPHQVQMMLKAQGKDFVYTVGDVALNSDEILTGWETACRLWNDSSPKLEGAKEEILFGSYICRHWSGLLLRLREKGFKLSNFDGTPPHGFHLH